MRPSQYLNFGGHVMVHPGFDTASEHALDRLVQRLELEELAHADGRNEDEPYKAIPLQRWDDRKVAKKAQCYCDGNCDGWGLCGLK